jgi:hypothetical protein
MFIFMLIVYFMYYPFATFLFRTPYFPFSSLPDFEEQRHAPVFREMLQIATPDLNEAIDKEEGKVQHSAYRYYQRACTRPTPFGLFAGCSVGAVGERTEIRLTEQKEYRRSTRLDMNYICALTQQIEKDRDIRQQLRYYPNSSIYPVGSHLRYVEYHYRKTHRVHRITQVENSEYLKKTLDQAGKGARFVELVAALTDDEITGEEAAGFIHELIDAQVLVSELEPAVTDVQPLSALIAKLNGLPNADRTFTGILSKIEAQLASIDRQPVGATGSIYPGLIKNIGRTKVEAEIKYLFQTDMFKPVTVSRNMLKDIQRALIFLNKITPPVTRTNLLQFRENFVKRYDTREIPLLFALDNELGIGYTGNTSGDISPLVDDLVTPRRNTPLNVSQPSIQFYTVYFIAKVPAIITKDYRTD